MTTVLTAGSRTPVAELRSLIRKVGASARRFDPARNDRLAPGAGSFADAHMQTVMGRSRMLVEIEPSFPDRNGRISAAL